MLPEVGGSPVRFGHPAPRHSANLVEENAYLGLLTLALALASLLHRPRRRCMNNSQGS